VPPDRSAALKAYAALLAAIGGIAWSAILVRWAGVPGAVSAFYRVLIAGAILIPWRLFAKAAPAGPPSGGRLPRRAWIAAGGGVFFALDLALWNTSVMRTHAAVASILGNNTPVFVGVMSWLVFHRRPRASFWIGLALALGGCAAIVSADLQRAAAGPGAVSGDLLALSASVFFAAYLVTTERVRTSMDTLTFNALAIGGSIAALLAVALVLRLPLGGFPPRTWLALAGLGLISQLAAYYALVYALGHLPATITSVGLLAQVPCTAILAAFFLGEPLSAKQIAGGVVVLTGILVVNVYGDR
jgi:drug/metabolite transporter (DMT)-like permease